MSLIKYLNNRKKDRIKIISDEFSEKLKEILSGFVIKSSPVISEIKKNFINCDELEKNLDEINYPNKNSLMISLKSNNFKSIIESQKNFFDWSQEIQNDICNKINSELTLYKAYIQNNKLTCYESDRIHESIMTSLNVFLESVKNKIKKIETKEDVFIVPCFNQNDLSEKKCHVFMGDSSFVVSENYEFSEIKNSQEIVEKIKENNQKIITLYFLQPISKRNYFENIKKDLCLGIKSLFPSNLEFFKEKKFENLMDLWKIKIEEKYLFEINENYKFINCNRFIKWIERVNEE